MLLWFPEEKFQLQNSSMVSCGMLPGGIVATGPAKRYAGRITPYVVLTCIVAASGGALFG